MKPTKTVKAAFFLPFQAIGKGAKFVALGWLFNERSGAKLQKPRDVRRWLNAGNTGLLLDGKAARLSEAESYQNVCVIARIGAGKTSRYIIPNVLDRANKNCSIVVNDPKGEVFAATSGAMVKAGFKIVVIDPEHPERSSRFNPLTEARDDIELEQIADILIRCGNPNPKDPFWNNGSIRLISVILKALRMEAAAAQPGIFTLGNLTYLLQNFGRLGAALDPFMARATIDPLNPQDQRLWAEWKGILIGNPDGVQSFVMGALTALRALSNQKLAWLTSASDFNLQDLRREKTVVYFITPPQLADYYGFFTSVFFQSVFNAAMRQMPGKNDLPLYVLYDEFGHSTIPAFAAIANTIRAYKVSLSIVLQSIAQLSHRYGDHAAHALQGGFNTIQTYAGSDPTTCRFFEIVCGRVRERQRKTPILDPNPQFHQQEFNLLNADEVRTLKSDETIIVSTNRDPVRMPSTAYFANGTFTRMSQRTAVAMPVRHVDLRGVPIVRV